MTTHMEHVAARSCRSPRLGGLLTGGMMAGAALALVFSLTPTHDAAAANVACVNTGATDTESWADPGSWTAAPTAPGGTAADNALACGDGAVADGPSATAYGNGAQAIGDDTVAIAGRAASVNSVALGSQSVAGIGGTATVTGNRPATVAALETLQAHLQYLRVTDQAASSAPASDAALASLLQTYLTGSGLGALTDAQLALLANSDVSFTVTGVTGAAGAVTAVAVTGTVDGGAEAGLTITLPGTANTDQNVNNDNRFISLDATAVGKGARATGANFAAAGNFAGSTAVGHTSSALGLSSTSIGANSAAVGTTSVAIGAGALALHANSIAIGAGAATSADNQVVLGTAAHNYHLPGLADAGADTPDLRSVFVNPDGQLSAGVMETMVTPEHLAATNARVEDVATDAQEGTAMAIAIAGAGMVPGKRSSISLNLGTFESQTAIAASAAALVDDSVVINGGLGFGFKKSQFGGQVGVSFGW